MAGLFYPADAEQLQHELADLLALANEQADFAHPPKAIIAPHAGYIYSGPVAASAYSRLAPVADRITRVILLGPAHRVPVSGLALSSAAAFSTPLGTVKVDRQAQQSIGDLPWVRVMDAAHNQEHSLEVHLPFLQMVLKDFSVVPIVVGEAIPEQVAEVLDRLWGGDETLIVISSDLSHYQDYMTARQMDARTSRAIELMEYEQLHFDDACGRGPVSGLLLLARQKHMTIETVDLRNSGDTAGSRDRVVGYGAYICH